MRLGKKPARVGAIPHKFSAFFSAPDLPTPPLVFGRPGLINDWKLLANDTVSDCVWADAAHQVMYWNALSGREAPRFTDASVISDYSAQTGYDPKRPETDEGTDLGEASLYWQKIGVLDAMARRHRIDISVSLRPSNIDEVLLATYLFGAVSLGIQLPESAQEQFDQAIPWEPIIGSSNLGGHCITCVGRSSRGNILVVTWGRLHAMTPGFLAQYMDEGIVSFSREMLRANDLLSPRGYNEAGLTALMPRLAA